MIRGEDPSAAGGEPGRLESRSWVRRCGRQAGEGHRHVQAAAREGREGRSRQPAGRSPTNSSSSTGSRRRCRPRPVNGPSPKPARRSVEPDGELSLRRPAHGRPEYDNAWGVRHIGAYPVHQAGITRRRASRSPSSTPASTTSTTLRRPSSSTRSSSATTRAATTSSTTTPTRWTTTATAPTSPGSSPRSTTAISSSASRPAVDLYALKVLGASGSGDYSGLIAALGWAVDHDIDVVNISLGGHDVSEALADGGHGRLRRGRHDRRGIRQRRSPSTT